MLRDGKKHKSDMLRKKASFRGCFFIPTNVKKIVKMIFLLIFFAKRCIIIMYYNFDKAGFYMLKAIGSKKELSSDSYYSNVSDIINSSELDKLKEITHHISTTRFQHCLNVSYYTYLICKKLHLDARAAARAGLLHDLFYYDRKNYNKSKVKGQLSHSSMHSRLAAENAADLTDISDLERDMIEKHMWPMTRSFPKYKESYIITLTDKYCAVLEFCIPRIKTVLS